MDSDTPLDEKLKAFKTKAGCDFQTAAMLVVAEALWGVATAIKENDIHAALRDCTSEQLGVAAQVYMMPNDGSN